MSKIADKELTIRTMRPDELNLVFKWTSDEGWNLALADFTAFMAADPSGLLTACLNGEPVAAMASVKYGENFGFVGVYIVRPDLRDCGVGYPLWQAGMAYLDGRIVGLDAVVAQQDNYARSGFSIAHRSVRYCGVPKISTPHHPSVQDLNPQIISSVLDYDRFFFPVNREEFLTYWLVTHASKSVAYIEDGLVKGYGSIRPAEHGYKIGPLFAETEREAEAIFCELAAYTDGAPLILDVPEPNLAATELALRSGLSPLFETARMYRGAAPELPLDRTFGLFTIEIG